jgi:hypothetical protein
MIRRRVPHAHPTRRDIRRELRYLRILAQEHRLDDRVDNVLGGMVWALEWAAWGKFTSPRFDLAFLQVGISKDHTLLQRVLAEEGKR